MYCQGDKKMKKIYGILIGAVLLLAMLPASGLAADTNTANGSSGSPLKAIHGNQYIVSVRNTPQSDNFLSRNAGVTISSDERNLDYTYTEDVLSDGACHRIMIRGVWGHSGDNISDGRFGTVMFKQRGRYGFIFEGLYNCNDNKSTDSIIGNENMGRFKIRMNNGFGNGLLITKDGHTAPITVLYKINRENSMIRLRWMTPHSDGWAVGKSIVPPANDISADAGN